MPLFCSRLPRRRIRPRGTRAGAPAREACGPGPTRPCRRGRFPSQQDGPPRWLPRRRALNTPGRSHPTLLPRHATLRGQRLWRLWRLWRLPIDATGKDVGTAKSSYTGVHGRLRAPAKVPGTDQLWLGSSNGPDQGRILKVTIG
ncbi:hypothetical protein [Streptomyces sp. NPDC007905]|uniref:hypothetical protein n=1 Tax=Streptomyces sp. NPDC007905 TaxID=3364788 RepID=UPI0036EB3AD3